MEQIVMHLADPITRLVDSWLRGQPGDYTEVELQELYRIARGFSLDKSASDTFRAPETIRSRRKVIYTKMQIQGAREIQASLLRFALLEGGVQDVGLAADSR
jgi:DNA-binding CsgD family transcriptional regulator